MSTRKQRVDAPRVSPTADQTIAALQEFTEHLTAYGFCFARREWYDINVSIVSDTYLRPYAKKVCKELGVPWVRANGGYYTRYEYVPKPPNPDGTYAGYKMVDMGQQWAGGLTVPKRNYLAPIVAPLLMVAEERVRSAPVSAYHERTNWCFAFTGDAGQEIFESHMQFMRTDPEARKALKILPK